MKKLTLFLVLGLLTAIQMIAQQKDHSIKNLKITILSTMLAQQGMGEWGVISISLYLLL